MPEFKVGCSPLTGKIYAGNVLKNNLWAKNKKEVTNSAVASVAEHLLIVNQKVQFERNGKTYELLVQEVHPVTAKMLKENG